jgi:LacI family transcriptional regulator/LacI family repressor for deo operon, udp, cdd, tsx, nupC, and nupG
LHPNSLTAEKVVDLRRQETSIEDIARVAGVSHSTVSRALNNSKLISVEMRERIQRLSQEMGYTPNAIARSLQNQRTNTIGLVVTSIADPFFSDIAKGVEEVAQALGFSIVLCISHNDPEQEMSIIETLHQRRVDGIIVAAARVSSIHQERLSRIQVPTILINSQTESQNGSPLQWVAIDDFAGARLAVEHLLQLGHCKIGYIGIESRPKSNRQRFTGYQQTLKKAGVAPQEDWVAFCPDGVYEDGVAGQNLLPRLIEAGVSAVFCYNDMVAIGALRACHERGIVVPDECSVVGFDDIMMADYVTPPLTTVHQLKVEMGQQAMEMVYDLLNGLAVDNHMVSPTLKVRASTATPVQP